MTDGRDDLTPPERSCQQAQIREKRCAVCIHRRHDGQAFGRAIWTCTKGLKWPKRGVCKGFVLDG